MICYENGNWLGFGLGIRYEIGFVLDLDFGYVMKLNFSLDLNFEPRFGFGS